MNRQAYPPISSYQTPQSNSPASMHSPPTDAHGRPMYAVPSIPQQMYYQQYPMQHQSPYSQQPTSHHSSMNAVAGMLMSHRQPQLQPQQQQPQSQSQTPTSMMDTKPTLASLQQQRPLSAAGGPSSSAGSNQNAAPGPIPATTPLVVRQDSNGVQWIAFEYSRDRVKMEYTIRCDVESVNVDELSQEFKMANCVYPRACCERDQYKGNRLHYETECNAVGWALAQLNPNLREKRGLIQRAVDSWRNSNQDVRLRSRRVRRQAKMNNRNASKTQNHQSQLSNPVAGPSNSVLQQQPSGMPSGTTRLPDVGNLGGPQSMHHHHSDTNDMGSGNDVSGMFHQL